ncbi:MAG TPA: class I SAM-dependent methyltransferase [Phenylobacterium sp.]|nr:class I SAM-dependent methyltransferase [Phenylobacterium sp.]
METSHRDTRLDPVDYDRVQHAAYAKGRALPARAIQRYMDSFARRLPARRPLTVVDLGSGTGRFTPALAETFGGRVYGIEPAAAMRRAAEAGSSHPWATYREGEAAAIPLPDASVDMILMFLSFHHVPDRAAAAKEIARVLKPGGRLFLRSTFSDRVPDHWWRSYFPRSQAVEEAMFPSEAEAIAVFEAAGLATAEVVHEEIPFEGDIAEAVAKLKLRAVSTFEHMTETELDEGFARIDAALAAGTIEEKSTSGDFMVFERPDSAQARKGSARA